jgi:Iodothyronine deiodinase
VASIGQIEKLHAAYKDKVDIYVVYIQEAHPSQPKNRFNVPQPKDWQERRKVAKDFAATLKVLVPVLVDTMDDAVGKAYAAWPDRLYVIDRDGKIAHQGGPGPFGFAPAVRAAPAILDKLLEQKSPGAGASHGP